MAVEERFLFEKVQLGIKCKTIRKERKILQRQMPLLADLSEFLVSTIERGKANVEFETLYKFKVALKVEIASLFEKGKPSLIPYADFIFNDLSAEKVLFSQRLVQLLDHRKVSQRDLSVIVNMGENVISFYVNGIHNIQLFTLVKIAMALQVEVFDLFNYQGGLPDNSKYKQQIIL